MEPMAKNPTRDCFAKVHDVFILTCLAYNKAYTNIPSASTAKNNIKGEGNIGFVQEAFSMVCDCCSGYFQIYGVYTLIYFFTYIVLFLGSKQTWMR